MDGGHFRDVFRETKVVRVRPQPSMSKLEPDHISFLGFAIAALEVVHHKHLDAEKVDFLIEKKTKIMRQIEDFVKRDMRDALADIRHGHLVRLIGNVIAGGKERVPLQAADVAMWHMRRHAAGEAEAQDVRRLGLMMNHRWMTLNGVTPEEITTVGDRSKTMQAPSPFSPKVRRHREDCT
jgi:hypothetical protein